jgi:hypothetical protein
VGDGLGDSDGVGIGVGDGVADGVSGPEQANGAVTIVCVPRSARMKSALTVAVPDMVHVRSRPA